MMKIYENDVSLSTEHHDLYRFSSRFLGIFTALPNRAQRTANEFRSMWINAGAAKQNECREFAQCTAAAWNAA